jgi:hypothetical protein
LLLATSAGVLCWAAAATAQFSGTLCTISSDENGVGHGRAVIGPKGLGAAPSDQSFAFEGACDNGYHVCSTGSAATATCAENLTSGNYVLCSGDCGFKDGLGNSVEPKPENVASLSASCGVSTPLQQGSFQGACAGSLCSGGGSNVAYALVFDQQTGANALETCPPAPVGQGGNVTEATFSGAILY